ncbi:MAG TPA: pyridine nucleotide-disulfide oxidoreductase [Chromatiaceae bacterium]|jgi:pyruvate/2-oxoglutarate dehydrogenase complex dihydrolipoamide dehydrogenase (E3) component/uncharacterized membrane protein YdjX (TVP38/TMEM64 family)|nr:pyridine nucleotide-disulfide oxidoreductase [Chromatiaceae bacterium]HIN82087.1 pyridine nucleotide-disulfide oxidoreductase [Chromatiales bacterium]HIA09298.1 pyridine nucleotide-disulfide oxidoreductase [Chromatiaceae bacterium]HIB85222.1 pyridine nucleotide-disulfide oxidoreductase [Chromatiaceae bacterium]HIO14611.1 pyridine nucleotide-disulfide oxidoreductase [Chromatiales bacterium]
MPNSRLVLLIAVSGSVALFFWLDLSRFLNLDYLLAQRELIGGYAEANPLTTAGLYFSGYVLVAGLSLPGATIMTLAGGAMFGLWWGVLIISFASTIGATVACLVSRFLLRDFVQSRFGSRLQAINDGFERQGAYYLFTLRLVPLFPFFAVNLLMGLVPIKIRTYAWVSQIGMLPATFVYVNAGTQLGQLTGLSGILAPELLLSFALLGVFPLAARKILDWMSARRTLAAWSKPKRFDRNLIVIGAGAGGLVASYIAAAVRAKVTLIEEHRMGGDCLNTGCVPSKALIRTARFLADARSSERLGLGQVDVEFDFAKVMARVRRVIQQVEPHDSVERYTELGVEVLQARAEIVSPWQIKVGDTTLSAPNIVVATGGRPAVPSVEGLQDINYLTSDTIWDLTALPVRLLVLGGGPIGCELAQCFARFGSHVTIVVRSARLLSREDDAVSTLLAKQLREDGIDLRFEHQMTGFRSAADGQFLDCDTAEGSISIGFDEVLVAVGRVANTAGFGLEALGVDLNTDGTLQCDAYMRSSVPTIMACGDVAGPYQFTHAAAHQAWYAAVNALFGRLRKFAVDYSALPHCTFTEPEVARVGLNCREADAQSIEYEITEFPLHELDRAIADDATQGFVRVLTVPGKDRILGATIVASHAGDMITEYVTAMRHGLGLNKILSTVHAYPTFSEANKYAAGEWKRQHAPKKLLNWVKRYHAWRRG